MKKIGIALTALLPLYGLPADAEDVTGFSGYGRAGAGGATGGGTQSCFQLPGAPAKYRLGNECEFYWELEANHEFHADDGKVLKIDAMTSLYHAYGHTPTFDGPDGDTRLPQIWASLSLPALKGARSGEGGAITSAMTSTSTTSTTGTPRALAAVWRTISWATASTPSAMPFSARTPSISRTRPAATIST